MLSKLQELFQNLLSFTAKQIIASQNTQQDAQNLHKGVGQNQRQYDPNGHPEQGKSNDPFQNLAPCKPFVSFYASDLLKITPHPEYPSRPVPSWNLLS